MAEQYNAGEVVGRVRFDVPQGELDKISQLQNEIAGVAQQMQGINTAIGSGASRQRGGVLGIAQAVDDAQRLNEELDKAKKGKDDASDEAKMSSEQKEAMKSFPRIMRQIGVTGGLITAVTAGIITLANLAKPQNDVAQTMEGAMRQISEAQKSIVFAINKDRFVDDAKNRIDTMKYVQKQVDEGNEPLRELAQFQYDMLEISMLGDRSYQVLVSLLAKTGDQNSWLSKLVGLFDNSGIKKTGDIRDAIGEHLRDATGTRTSYPQPTLITTQYASPVESSLTSPDINSASGAYNGGG